MTANQHFPYQKEFVEIQKRIQVALGEAPADLVLRNVNLVNVHTEEIYPADILISGDRIAAVLEAGSGAGENVIECSGLYAVPGLIDAHVHIESHALALNELARLIVPMGVTTLLADPHEIANVLGIKGIRLLLQDANQLPLRVLLQIPARVPTAPGVETTGGVIGLPEVQEMLTWESSVSLGELDPSKVVPPLPEYIAKVVAAGKAHRIVNGHAAELTGRHLNAYVSAGIYDDHEGVTAEGAIERARLGMASIAREGTNAHNVPGILKAVTQGHLPTRNILMCTDDKLPHEVLAQGDIDYNVRLAIREGIPPIQAIQMATLNPATHFHLDETLGSLAPGKMADILLVSDLENFKVEKVIFSGSLVAEKGKLLVELPRTIFPEWAVNTVKLSRRMRPEDFWIPYSGSKSKVKALVIDIRRYSTEFIKIPQVREMDVRGGQVMASVEKDLLKIAVVERHKRSGNIGLGLIEGFGLKAGAVASSVSHDHHNIVVIGVSDEDMAVAVNELADLQGGFIAVLDGKVLASVPLQFGGLMSIEPYEQAVEKLNQLDLVVKEKLGCPLSDPIMMLLGISLPTIPEIGISDLGVTQISGLDRQPHVVKVIVED